VLPVTARLLLALGLAGSLFPAVSAASPEPPVSAPVIMGSNVSGLFAGDPGFTVVLLSLA
jgi:hypothetical protein